MLFKVLGYGSNERAGLNVGAEIINELVTSVDFSNKLKIIKCDSGKIIKTKSVIICTEHKLVGLELRAKKI